MIADNKRYHVRVNRLNPSLFLRFGEPDGSLNAVDLSGNGLNGTYQNSPEFGVEGPVVHDETTAVLLNGTDQYISVPDDPIFDTGDVASGEGWIKRTTASGDRFIISKGANGYLLYHNAGMLILDKRNVSTIVGSTTVIPVGIWTHVAFTKNGSTVKLYINGVDVTGTVVNATIESTASALTIGGEAAAGFFAGSIGNAAIYPTALTPAEVKANYMLGREIFGECPVYGVRIQNADGSGPDYRYVTAELSGEAAWINASKLLVPEDIAREADPRESRFKVGRCSFGLLDFDGEITAVIGDFIGKECTFYYVDYMSDWTNGAVTLFTGIVTEFTLQDKVYYVTARSPIILADKELFNSGRTKVQTGINSSATAVVVEDASGFADTGVIIIGDERIAYASRSDGGSTWTLGGLTRGHLGSTAASHAAGDAVTETFILGPDHPFALLRDILLAPADGKTGLGMSEYVNSPEMTVQINAVGVDLEMFFEVQGPVNAKDWIEEQIYRPMAAYPIENHIGQVLIKIFSTASTTVSSITDDVSLNRATWEGNFPLRVNHVTYLYDYDVASDEFQSSFIVKDDGLIAAYGIQPLLIEAKGIHSDVPEFDTLMSERGLAYINRFGLELPTISVATFARKRLLECGDDVATTFSHLINVSAGEIGLSNAPAELIAVRHRLADGRMEFAMISHQPIFDVLAPEEPSFGGTSYPTVTVA